MLQAVCVFGFLVSSVATSRCHRTMQKKYVSMNISGEACFLCCVCSVYQIQGSGKAARKNCQVKHEKKSALPFREWGGGRL